MNKINYINKEKIFKILATGAILLSSTMLTGCDQINDWQKTSVVSNSLENVMLYKENGEETTFSDLYYVQERETGEVFICKKTFLDAKLKTELTFAITKYIGLNGQLGLPIGDSGVLLTTKTDRYYAFTDIDTNEVITITKNGSGISEDRNYEVSYLLNLVADEIVNEMPVDYTKDQVKEEMQYYPKSYSIDEIKDMLNIDSQKEY